MFLGHRFTQQLDPLLTYLCMAPQSHVVVWFEDFDKRFWVGATTFSAKDGNQDNTGPPVKFLHSIYFVKICSDWLTGVMYDRL